MSKPELSIKESIHLLITEADTNEQMGEAVYCFVKEIASEAIGAAWAEACIDADNGMDIRKREIPGVLYNCLGALGIKS